MEIALCLRQLSFNYFQWSAIVFHEREKESFCTSSGDHKRGCSVISNNGMTFKPSFIEGKYSKWIEFGMRGNHKRGCRVISNNGIAFIPSIIEGKNSKWKEFSMRSMGLFGILS
ncbi:hypothetical protein CEXT_189931 [Caerostris extrusa]|uniref:Uncharacterized protein n=1 Tax=Caerostris extrusa TaxID=172846 RepID=A0AAV4RB75_CAEEX|nr:hypothetical protein CEXT_189931 [Caerostris extrusa]